MKYPKPKSVTIDSVVIIDEESESESTVKTVIPDEILSEKELQSPQSAPPPKNDSAKQQSYNVQDIIDMHNRMSKSYIVRRRGSIRAKICLVLGFIGIFLFRVPVISTSAIILGFWELKAINKKNSPVAGRRLAQIGLILGFIGIGLVLAKILFWLKLG